MSKNTHNQKIGFLGESLVADGLKKRGFTLLDKNIRTPYGEVDLVVKKGSLVVFVEVKTRITKSLGYPEEALTLFKRNNLRRSVLYLLERFCQNNQWSILVVAVELNLKMRVAKVHALEFEE